MSGPIRRAGLIVDEENPAAVVFGRLRALEVTSEDRDRLPYDAGSRQPEALPPSFQPSLRLAHPRQTISRFSSHFPLGAAPTP